MARTLRRGILQPFASGADVMHPYRRWPQWSIAARFALLLIIVAPSLGLSRATHAQPFAIKIAGYQYAPGNVNIKAGTLVVWSNSDNDTHNVAIDQGPELFVSPVLKRGDETRFYFTRMGVYEIFCEWHPQMKSRITVEPNPALAAPPPLGSRFFNETGRSVRGTFLHYWQTHGGLAQQGFPISEEMAEKSDTDGKFYTVQYFERAVFEYHPENQPPNDVLLSLLGNFE